MKLQVTNLPKQGKHVKVRWSHGISFLWMCFMEECLEILDSRISRHRLWMMMKIGTVKQQGCAKIGSVKDTIFTL